MTEQQQHLANLLTQRQSILDEINSSQQELNNKRDLALKVQGAIEYLQQIGVTLPEPETEETEETEDDQF